MAEVRPFGLRCVQLDRTGRTYGRTYLGEVRPCKRQFEPLALTGGRTVHTFFVPFVRSGRKLADLVDLEGKLGDLGKRIGKWGPGGSTREQA
jgi:hypothetical protein